MARSALPWSRLLAEFVVIVVGVLVALAVDAMVDRNEARNREQTYIAELRVEVADLEKTLQGIVENQDEVRETQQRLIDGLASQVLPSADSLGQWFDRSLRTNVFRPYTPIADALIETGDLALIRDDDLRRAIIAYRSTASGAREVLNAHTSMTVDAYARIYRRVDRPSAARGEVDWRDLAGDIAFRGDVATYRTSISVQAGNFRRVLDAVVRLKGELERQVAR